MAFCEACHAGFCQWRVRATGHSSSCLPDGYREEPRHNEERAAPADDVGSIFGGEPGQGQGTTTREFGESTGDLYASGGYYNANNGTNGEGNGADNTGNGAGGTNNNNKSTVGGSGIVVIRNHRKVAA